MKKMRRFLAIALTLAMVLSLAACGGTKEADTTTPRSAPAQETAVASAASRRLGT